METNIMWLKAFESGDKLLSETEFWILTVVSDGYEPPSEIIDRLLQQTKNWTPKGGTIYPILHRLADVDLLEKKEADGLMFKRSPKARVFLSSIGKPLRVQISESCNYYHRILQNLANLDKLPARYDQILRSLVGEAQEFINTVQTIANDVQERVDQAYDVPISFEE